MNKNCSVCQVRSQKRFQKDTVNSNNLFILKVDFETRKSFIEHCQVVHGMKFKTKSGISIPPPPSSPTVGVKRKHDNGNDW